MCGFVELVSLALARGWARADHVGSSASKEPALLAAFLVGGHDFAPVLSARAAVDADIAARAAIVRALLAAGANPCARNSLGDTAQQRAAAWARLWGVSEHPAAVELLATLTRAGEGGMRPADAPEPRGAAGAPAPSPTAASRSASPSLRAARALEIGEMTVKQLKQELAARGVPLAGLAEKADLVAALVGAESGATSSA